MNKLIIIRISTLGAGGDANGESQMDFNTKEDVERAYKKFSDKLNNVLQQISSSNAPILNEVTSQYNRTLAELIRKSQKELADTLRNSIWDKLVIAFVGITNAGKSTIIETFRILFNEPERKEALRRNPSGVDGTIIGDGRADFTKVYKEYNMSINGKPFILIDVPGIEGNESSVREEIVKALNRAHCVFYVQGEGKKPDEGTVKKIKEYLKDWVEVYSIFNVKGSSFNYDEVEERASFKTGRILDLESQIESVFRNTLGVNYTKNITIQAQLALCSYASFDLRRVYLRKEQTTLISSFGSKEKLFDFSNFQEIENCVDYLSSNFATKIAEAQKRKFDRLCKTAINNIKAIKNN